MKFNNTIISEIKSSCRQNWKNNCMSRGKNSNIDLLRKDLHIWLHSDIKWLENRTFRDISKEVLWLLSLWFKVAACKHTLCYTPYLSVFSANAGKYGPEKTPYLDMDTLKLKVHKNLMIKPKEHRMYVKFRYYKCILRLHFFPNTDFLWSICARKSRNWSKKVYAYKML